MNVLASEGRTHDHYFMYSCHVEVGHIYAG